MCHFCVICQLGVFAFIKEATKITRRNSYVESFIDRCRSSCRRQKCKQQKDGSVYLTFMSNQLQETLHWVMSFGSSVQVVNPPELVDMVKEEIKKLKKMY